MDTRSPEDIAELQQQEIDEILRWFQYGHLTPGARQQVSKLFADLAMKVTATIAYHDQLKQCLYDLLRAKDCAVRAVIAEEEKSRKGHPLGVKSNRRIREEMSKFHHSEEI